MERLKLTILWRLCNKKLLMDGWKRRVAYYVPPGTEDVDIIIPVVVGRKLPGAHHELSHLSPSMAMEIEGGAAVVDVDYEPTEDDMFAIVVQVKNRNDKISKKDAHYIVQKMYSPVRDKIYGDGLCPIFSIVCNVRSGQFADNLTGQVIKVAL